MPTLKIVNRAGAETEIEGQSDLSVMENIRNSGIDELLAICGGCCACATCHVYVDDEWMDKVGPRNSDEDDLLDSSGHRQPNSRLSCQIRLNDALDGVRVTIAPED
jgi:2Fe-2S ferredoxin